MQTIFGFMKFITIFISYSCISRSPKEASSSPINSCCCFTSKESQENYRWYYSSQPKYLGTCKLVLFSNRVPDPLLESHAIAFLMCSTQPRSEAKQVNNWYLFFWEMKSQGKRFWCKSLLLFPKLLWLSIRLLLLIESWISYNKGIHREINARRECRVFVWTITSLQNRSGLPLLWKQKMSKNLWVNTEQSESLTARNIMNYHSVMRKASKSLLHTHTHTHTIHNWCHQ